MSGADSSASDGRGAGPEAGGDVQKRLRAFFREGGHEQIVALAHEAARKGRAAELPNDLPDELRAALLAAGIRTLLRPSAPGPTTCCGPPRMW